MSLTTRNWAPGNAAGGAAAEASAPCFAQSVVSLGPAWGAAFLQSSGLDLQVKGTEGVQG